MDARPAAEAINNWRDTKNAIKQWKEQEGPLSRRLADLEPRITWRELADETVRCGDDDQMCCGPAFSFDGHRMIRWRDAGEEDDDYFSWTDSEQKPKLQQVQFDDARGARAFWEMVCRVQGVEVNRGRGLDGQPAARRPQDGQHLRHRYPEMWDTCLKAAEFRNSPCKGE